jgi:hypothetical protein
MVEAGRNARRIYSFRFSSKYGAHLAALLIAALPLCAQDVSFTPAITQDEFAKFSRTIAQAIFADPVQPARASSVLGFDVGVAVTAVKVDTGASWWQHSVPASSDFTHNGYAGVPRLVASKGFGAGTISATYAQVSNSGIKTYGGAVDVPIIRGSVVTPELALRGSYSTLTGIDVFKLKTYGVEAFLSKGFGPVTPYVALGKMRSDATGRIDGVSILPFPTLEDSTDVTRYTAGVRLSLLLPKLVVQVTKAQVTSYSAKISLGF